MTKLTTRQLKAVAGNFQDWAKARGLSARQLTTMGKSRLRELYLEFRGTQGYRGVLRGAKGRRPGQGRRSELGIGVSGPRRVRSPAPAFDDEDWDEDEDDDDDEETEEHLRLERRFRPAPSRRSSLPSSGSSHLDNVSTEALVTYAKALQRRFRREMALRRAQGQATGGSLASRHRRELLERAAKRVAIAALKAGTRVRTDDHTIRLAVGQLLHDRTYRDVVAWNGNVAADVQVQVNAVAGLLRSSWSEVERIADQIAAGQGGSGGGLSYDEQLRLGWRDYGEKARENPFGMANPLEIKDLHD